MAIWIFVPVYFFSSDEKCRIIFYRSLANIDFLLSLVFLGVIKLNLQCTTTQYYPFHVKTLSFFFSTTRPHLFFAFWGPDPSPVIVRLGLGLEFLSLNFLETFICNKVCILQKKSALQNLKFRGTGCFEDYFDRKRKKCLYCL